MTPAELQEVFRGTALASLLYAAPAWWGFTLAEESTRLNSYLNKSKSAGFYRMGGPTIEVMIAQSEQTLFNSIKQNQHHVLYQFLPPKTDHPYNLRTRAHPFVVPAKTTSLADNFF